MDMDPQCVPCLIKRCQYEARLVDSAREREVTEAVLAVLADGYGPAAASAPVATRAHGEVNRVLGTDDPYRALKDRANATAGRLAPAARDMIVEADDPLRAAMLVAAVGNLLDFGIEGGAGSPENLERTFREHVGKGFAVDHTERISDIVGKGAEVAFLTDNCGEVVLDALLWDELRARGARLTAIAKDRPVLSDVTVGEVRSLGLAGRCDRLLGTGPYHVGCDVDGLPEDTLRAMEGADLVIAKGMANFESIGTGRFRPIAFLLKAKCEPVARAIGAQKGDNVAALFE